MTILKKLRKLRAIYITNFRSEHFYPDSSMARVLSSLSPESLVALSLSGRGIIWGNESPGFWAWHGKLNIKPTN
jgi:hypothetical protein